MLAEAQQLLRESCERLEALSLHDALSAEAVRRCLSPKMERPNEAAARVVMALREQALSMSAAGKQSAQAKRLLSLKSAYPELEESLRSHELLTSVSAASLGRIEAGTQHVHGGYTPAACSNGGEPTPQSLADNGLAALALSGFDQHRVKTRKRVHQ